VPPEDAADQTTTKPDRPNPRPEAGFGSLPLPWPAKLRRKMPLIQFEHHFKRNSVANIPFSAVGISSFG